MNWLRKLLGIDNDKAEILAAIQKLHEDMVILRSDFTITLGADESDPRRRAASDVIGRQVMKRLLAEDMARKRSTGEL